MLSIIDRIEYSFPSLSSSCFLFHSFMYKYVFFFITIDVRVNLRTPQLIPRGMYKYVYCDTMNKRILLCEEKNNSLIFID